MDNALQFVAPLRLVLDIDGTPFEITPVVTAEVPPLIRLCEPFFGVLAAMQGEPDPATITSLVGKYGEAVIKTVALCAHQPEEWVGKLLPDRFVALAVACIQVNADFFAQAAPILRALVSQAVAPSAGAAPAAPNSSTGPLPSSS